jgi:Na+-driven multidrug efflux pump
MRLCIAAVALVVILGALFPELALRIYTNDPMMIRASLPALYVVNLAALLHAPAFIFFNGVSGTGKTQVAFFIELMTIVVYLAIAFLLAEILKTEVYIVWMSEYVYAILLGAISYLYLAYGHWKSARI